MLHGRYGNNMVDLHFYNNKNVLVTGHTGFKGSWLCHILYMAGANVTGYALDPPTNPNMFDITNLGAQVNSNIGDIRDYKKLKYVFESSKPEIVFHLAAQPIVRTSYELPMYTYETNVMGTVNLLECIRHSDTVRSVINITTDKVYDNKELDRSYVEDDVLDGYDPYSNSKSCSELVTHSYKRSFFSDGSISISTARAGNVIGGGDFAKDRIIPDCIRAAKKSEKIIVRNPYSIRPYQHVLEPIYAYILIAMKQYDKNDLAGTYNVGPNDIDCVDTGTIADLFCSKWGNVEWVNKSDGGPHEAGFLKLDCSKLKATMAWQPKWDVSTAVEKVVEWSKAYFADRDMRSVTEKQIVDFLYEE